jgi:UDP-glucuronate 4-epimerase
MKILITGVCGFIGFNLCEKLIKNKKNLVIGIDSIDNYYSTKLKLERLKILKKNINFIFYKININNSKKLKKIFTKHKFDKIIHLAAQAGVRYSIVNPKKFIDYNVIAFFNVLESIRLYNKKATIIYASSSSVYGENKNYPLKEKNYLMPKNIYGLTKKFNEELADNYFKNYKLNIIGLRFFTIFGEWGRPDMFIMKYLISYFKKKQFNLNNKGNHYRDFTYIGDVISIIIKLIKKKNLSNHQIYNICSNRPISLKTIIKFFNKNKINPKIKLKALQASDMLKTHGDNTLIKEYIKFKQFTKFELALKKTLNWFILNKNKF